VSRPAGLGKEQALEPCDLGGTPRSASTSEPRGGDKAGVRPPSCFMMTEFAPPGNDDNPFPSAPHAALTNHPSRATRPRGRPSDEKRLGPVPSRRGSAGNAGRPSGTAATPNAKARPTVAPGGDRARRRLHGANLDAGPRGRLLLDTCKNWLLRAGTTFSPKADRQWQYPPRGGWTATPALPVGVGDAVGVAGAVRLPRRVVVLIGAGGYVSGRLRPTGRRPVGAWDDVNESHESDH